MNRHHKRPNWSRTVLAVCAMLPVTGAIALDIVATIAPIHSLLSLVTEGVSQPHLLLDPRKSPHTYQMRPSDAAAIRKAQAVFRVSPELEVFLNKQLANLDRQVRVVNIVDLPALQLYPARPEGTHRNAPELEGDHAHAHASDHSKGLRIDAHVWMDPRNAQSIVRGIATVLTDLDPANQSTYETNAARAVARLTVLDERAAAQLIPLRNQPFVVFHDAYQYLERRYQLTNLGAVSNLAAGSSSAQRLGRLQQEIQRNNVHCVFLEPQFDPGIAAKLTALASIKTTMLDPNGAGIAPGPEAYFTMFENNVRNLTSCLNPSFQ